jgi:hypothetical protein
MQRVGTLRRAALARRSLALWKKKGGKKEGGKGGKRREKNRQCICASVFLLCTSEANKVSPRLFSALHTSTKVQILTHQILDASLLARGHAAYVSIRQHTSAYVSIRQHTHQILGASLLARGHKVVEVSVYVSRGRRRSQRLV